uniref:(northern house mosquito) hypothetical protein n=1 Tax=Culex pipiens TaxID=7175 RepID=A0A8D8DUB0_CULPI
MSFPSRSDSCNRSSAAVTSCKIPSTPSCCPLATLLPPGPAALAAAAAPTPIPRYSSMLSCKPAARSRRSSPDSVPESSTGATGFFLCNKMPCSSGSSSDSP